MCQLSCQLENNFILNIFWKVNKCITENCQLIDTMAGQFCHPQKRWYTFMYDNVETVNVWCRPAHTFSIDVLHAVVEVGFANRLGSHSRVTRVDFLWIQSGLFLLR